MKSKETTKKPRKPAFDKQKLAQYLKKLIPPKNEIAKPLFSSTRVVCRLIALWCLYVASTLFTENDYTKLEFNQNGALRLFLWLLVGFLVLSAAALVFHRYHTDSLCLFFGSTTCVILWGLSPPSNNTVLFWLALGTAYALFLIFILRENEALLAKIHIGNKTVIIIGVSAAVIACVILSVISCLRYRTFSSPNFDFGIFVNMFHNMRETGLPDTTCERDRLLSHFDVHISPIYYLLLPFYYLFPSPYTLQIGQAILLLSGVLPVILLSRHRKLSGKATSTVASLRLLYRDQHRMLF